MLETTTTSYFATRSRNYPTIGVLAGWQVYEGMTIGRYLHMVLQGVRAAAEQRGCNLLLGCGIGAPSRPSSTTPAWPTFALDASFVPVGSFNTDALIVVPPFLSKAHTHYLHQLRVHGFPVVFAGVDEYGPAVIADSAGGIAQAFRHLVAHGHQQIAFIAGYDGDGMVGESTERLNAYKAALQAHDFEYDPRLVGYGLHNPDDAYNVTRHMLSSGAAFTAVLTSNDASAIGATRALREAGLRIPQDVAIVGFDDELDAKAEASPLTTIRHPTFEVGYHALELALDYLYRRRTEPTTIIIPARLVIRQSCGCTPGAQHTHAPSHNDATPTLQPLFTQLAQRMAEVTLVEAHYLGADDVLFHCQHLCEALTASLEQHDKAPFAAALASMLEASEAVGEDPHVWHAMLSVLRDAPLTLPAPQPNLIAQRFADSLFDLGRLAISERARQQSTRSFIQQARMADRLGLMTAELLAALDETELLAILAQHLPEMGVQRVHVVMFQPDEDEPRAWSTVLQGGASGSRFPTTQFPPTSLYEPETVFQLALLPLVIHDQQAGFLAFEGQTLEPYAAITRQFAAAMRSSRLYREAIEGRRSAEEANGLKSRFLAMVSHELRTPLNLIVGLSEIVVRDMAAGTVAVPVVQQDVERIYGSAQHLGLLIRDVLDLASSDAGQLRLAYEQFDLADVLEQAAISGAQLAQEKRIGWHAALPPGRMPVWGDRTRIQQVVFNLITNAIKFTSDGTVTLASETGQEQITVTVCDTGLGIPPAELDSIFDAFRQSERTSLRGYGGMGLGLAICKQIVERHGGTIRVVSPVADGRGSAFTFTLPRKSAVMQLDAQPLASPKIDAYLLQPTDDGQTDDAFSRDVSGGEADGQQTVLIVDDEPGLLDLHARIVQAQWPAARVLTARHGREALAIIHDAHPDLVLLDLMMPELDGFGVLEALQAGETTRDIPVIVLTAQTLNDSEMTRLNRGVVTVLEKGIFSADETLRHIDAVLTRSRKQGTAAQRLVRRAISYIHAAYREQISREHIAHHVGASEDYLTHCFQQELGITPMAYLTRHRMRQARALLEGGDLSVADVAAAVGYENSAYFNRVFQREIGIAPGAYRRGQRPPRP